MADPRQLDILSDNRTIASPVQCDLRNEVVANLRDSINAAWNGWEQASKFEDDGMQTYYMKYIKTLMDCLEKVKKI